MGHWHSSHWVQSYVDASGAIHNQCLTEVQTIIRNLGLAGVASASIVVKKLPLERTKDNDSLSYPIIIITPEQSVLNPTAGSNVQDDIVYGVGVNVVDDDNQERTLAANINKYLLWLQEIRKAFHSKRLQNITTVNTCAVVPMPPVSQHHWLNNFWASGHLLKFTSRENRNS
ncbi:hypothetical protein LCGC14_0325680 [marine sediment metagenome]|uniref:Uncharacterized protein n=1 Tax=marine sediment metagenome TaxID=412755 RepID=A0A0F9U0G6_9ZZZZ